MNTYKCLRALIIFLIITAWLYSAWPQIWQKPPIPPKIQKVLAQNTIFYETFPNQDTTWNGSSDTAQDEPGWVTDQGLDTNDIQVYNEDVAAGDLPPSGGTHLDFEDCDEGVIPVTNDYACVPINLSGYISVAIEYYWQTDDTDAGEWLQVAYSTDATDCTDGTWTQIGYFDNPTEDTWTKETYNLSDADAVSTFRLRFASKSNSSLEHFYVDDAKVTGTPAIVYSVTITSPDPPEIAYGAMAMGSTKASVTITATVGGTATKLNIKGADATYTEAGKCTDGVCAWTLDETVPIEPGTDIYIHAFTKDTALASGGTLGSNPATQWVALTKNSDDNILAASVPANNSQDFKLDMRTPSTAGGETELGKQYSTTVTIVASAP